MFQFRSLGAFQWFLQENLSTSIFVVFRPQSFLYNFVRAREIGYCGADLLWDLFNFFFKFFSHAGNDNLWGICRSGPVLARWFFWPYLRPISTLFLSRIFFMLGWFCSMRRGAYSPQSFWFLFSSGSFAWEVYPREWAGC